MPIGRCPKCGGRYPARCWGPQKDPLWGKHICEDCGYVGKDNSDIRWMSSEEITMRDPLPDSARGNSWFFPRMREGENGVQFAMRQPEIRPENLKDGVIKRWTKVNPGGVTVIGIEYPNGSGRIYKCPIDKENKIMWAEGMLEDEIEEWTEPEDYLEELPELQEEEDLDIDVPDNGPTFVKFAGSWWKELSSGALMEVRK